MRILFFILCCTVNLNLMAQSSIEGVYRYSHREMVATFTFSSGNQFTFFYSYGAADRYAQGTFTREGNIIKLKSDKEPGKDFTVTHSEKNGKGYRIQFEHPQRQLLQHIRCLVFVGNEQHEFFSDANGVVDIPLTQCSRIYAQHLLYPDVVSVIKEEGDPHNQFKATLNPSLEQVSFKGIDLTIEDEETLSCLPNYFMMIEGIRFYKEE